MFVLRAIVSWCYAIAVSIRNMLYDEHLLPSYNVPLPTICIGNLVVGGTGKTPHTEYLARELSKHFRVAVLSRGYKRKTRGFLLANDNSTALTIGDEPMQMHLNLPQVTIAVCENRVSGVRKLHKMFPDLQVVLLDDAYQHRQLHCGFYILLTAASNLYINDHFFPLGKLREARHGSLRANMIVVTKCPEAMQPIDRRVIETSLHIPTYQTLWFSYLRYSSLMPVWQNSSNSECIGTRPLVLTGIEDAKPMLEYLKTQYADIHTLQFSDHHSFTKRDFATLKQTCDRENCDCIITTQKDAARLTTCNDYPDELRDCTFMLPVQVDFRGQEQHFLQPLMQYVTENHKKQKH